MLVVSVTASLKIVFAFLGIEPLHCPIFVSFQGHFEVFVLKVEKCTKDFFDENINFEISNKDDELLKKAKKANLSVGRYEIVEKYTQIHG